MPTNDPSTAHTLLDIATEHWHYTLLFIGSACGSIYWAAQQKFATQQKLEMCKSEIIKSLDEHKAYDDARIKRFMDKNDMKHDAIEAKVDRLIDHIIEGNIK